MRSFAFLIALASCGSDPSPRDAGMDAPRVDADAPLDAPNDAPSGRLYAFVSIERWTRSTERQVTMGGMPIFHTDDPAPRYRRIDDQCLVHYETDWAATGLVPPTAGTITIEGVAGGPVTWVDYGFDVSPDGFDAGDVLTVRATGGEIPAFTFSGTVPEVPVLTSHDNTGPGPDAIHVPRTTPFDLTWEPVDAEIFVVFLQGDQPGFVIRRGIHCFFPGAVGAGSVPVAALAELLPTSSIDTTNFYFARVVRDRRELTDIDIDFLLWNARQTRVTVD